MVMCVYICVCVADAAADDAAAVNAADEAASCVRRRLFVVNMTDDRL